MALIVDHLLIVEIQIAGAASANDFVKLFNPTQNILDVGGWKLRKKTSTGTDTSLREFPSGSVVAPNGYFIWANSSGGFGDVIGANVTSTGSLASDNSVALFNTEGTIVDAVAWGAGDNQYGEVAAYPTNPAPNEILKRKLIEGAFVDTDNNENNFGI